jgi:hypothetical protein
LESFLFTRESFEQAKGHLTENGLFVLYNFYREDWLIDKIAFGLTEVFGEVPYISVYGQAGKAATILSGPKTAELAAGQLQRREIKEKLATADDDWPFLYLKERRIPSFYLKFVGILFLISVVAVWWVLRREKKASFDFRFFFFGAAFLLLETKSLVTFGLLFGNTWLVNSLVFTGILLAVLLANWLSMRYTVRPTWLLYVALFASLVLIYLVSVNQFLEITLLARYFAATAFYFSPIFLANILFSQLFKVAQQAEVSFGSNTLGAVFGGLFEYSSLFYLFSLVKFRLRT